MNNIAVGILIVLLFVGVIILFFVVLVKLYIRKINKYTAMIHQKDLDHQRAITSSIVETQEQVLNDISRDLHDDAGQQLTYLNFQIENLKLDSPELGTTLDPLSKSVNGLSKTIRSISHSLNNQLLMQEDLVKAITAESDVLRQRSSMDVNLSVTGNGRSLGSNEKIVIYRIFQETVNNILKHSGANKIDIGIVTSPSFALTVSDNGKGFDTGNVAEGRSLGMNNMQTRANLIDYGLDIESVPGNGTTITLTQRKHGKN